MRHSCTHDVQLSSLAFPFFVLYEKFFLLKNTPLMILRLFKIILNVFVLTPQGNDQEGFSQGLFFLLSYFRSLNENAITQSLLSLLFLVFLVQS